MSAGRALAFAGLALAVVAVLLQFAITMPASMQAGRSFVGSLVFFFSFFTILTNIAVGMTYLAALTSGEAALPRWFRQPTIRAGVAVAITVVMITYATVLARLWQPVGLFYLCNVLLHYVAPVLYLAWWLVAGADGSTRWRDIPAWLIYPIVYLCWVELRAPFAGEVPYLFLDIPAKGLPSVILASISMLMLFVLVSAAAVLADRIVGAKRLA